VLIILVILAAIVGVAYFMVRSNGKKAAGDRPQPRR
jgi:flagellar basal body-associated protein FliL